MFTIAAVVFALAALGGVTMAYIHFKQDRNPPGALAVIHGLAAAGGLLILLWAVLQSGAAVSSSIAWALGLFVVAALGGFFLVSYHIRGLRLPSPVVLIHGTVAVVAFLLLLAGIMAVKA